MDLVGEGFKQVSGSVLRHPATTLWSYSSTWRQTREQHKPEEILTQCLIFFSWHFEGAIFLSMATPSQASICLLCWYGQQVEPNHIPAKCIRNYRMQLEQESCWKSRSRAYSLSSWYEHDIASSIGELGKPRGRGRKQERRQCFYSFNIIDRYSFNIIDWVPDTWQALGWALG